MKANKQIKTAVGYARTATIEQDSKVKIGVQEKRIKAYCIKNGIKLSKIYVDLGKSGSNVNRPALQDMLSRCSKGDIKCLIVLDSSRISRNTKDYLTIRALLAKYNVEIIALTGISSSGDDPYSKFIDEILAAVNALHPKLSNIKKRKKTIKADVR